MLKIIEFLLFLRELLLHHLDLLLALEIIISNIELQQDILCIDGLSLEAIDLVVLRNLIVDIKHTFKELGIQDFFISEYNNFRINPEIIKCDYYDFLNGDQTAVKSFMGEFLSQYSWAEDVAGLLELKALKI